MSSHQLFRTALASITAIAGLSSLTACSALTKPEEITIFAEPVRVANPAPAPAAPDVAAAMRAGGVQTPKAPRAQAGGG